MTYTFDFRVSILLKLADIPILRLPNERLTLLHDIAFYFIDIRQVFPVLADDLVFIGIQDLGDLPVTFDLHIGFPRGLEKACHKKEFC